jgi:hypothetical protein
MKNKMKNINEEINRIKSLFTEERLYGNLVEKEVITEQGRKVLKLGRRMWDDAITAMKKANKSIPTIPQATKDKFFTALDNVKKLDDMKTIVQNREFDQMWKIMGLKKTQIDNVDLVLTRHIGDLGKMVGDYPAYAYITKKHNLREDMVTLFFLNADDATRNKFLKAHYDGTVKGIDITKSSEANVSFIDKIMKNSDEVKKVIDSEAAAAQKKIDDAAAQKKIDDTPDSDSGSGKIPTSRDVPPKPDSTPSTFKINSLEELDELITTLTKKDVTTEIKVVMADGGELIVKIDGRTSAEILEEMGSQIPKGFSDQAKKGILKRMKDYIGSLKINKNVKGVLNFATGGNVWTDPWFYKMNSGGKEWVLVNRLAKFIGRAIPLTYTYWSYEMGRPLGIGEYFGTAVKKSGVNVDEAEEWLVEQICDAGYTSTDGAFNCDNFYVIFKDAATNAINSGKLDCTKLMENDYDENKKYLFGNIDIKYVTGQSKMSNEKDVEKKIWSKYKKDWDDKWSDYLGKFPGGNDWEEICQEVINDKVLECTNQKNKKDLDNSGYEFDDDNWIPVEEEGETSETEVETEVESGCLCPNGNWSPLCCDDDDDDE